MKKYICSATLILIIIVSGSIFIGCNRNSDLDSSKKTSLNRILSEKKIRCGYLVYSPYIRKDPNTKKMSGIFYDIMEKIGKNADLKIEWTEEVGYENIFTGLDADRYDVFAGGLWPNTSRAKVGFFTVPVFYSIITAWVSANSSRLTDLSQINSSNVKIATIDGAMEDLIAKTDFPNASRLSLPELSPFSQNLLNITSNKADVTFAEPGIIQEYLKTNPNTLKPLSPEKPLRIFGNSLVVKLGDIEFREFLDVALKELLYSGQIDLILKKYEPGINTFPRVSLPYEFQNPK